MAAQHGEPHMAPFAAEDRGLVQKGRRIVPTYQYRCRHCGTNVDKTRPMPALGQHMRAPKCPRCGHGTLRVFGAVTVGFRGGGLNRH